MATPEPPEQGWWDSIVSAFGGGEESPTEFARGGAFGMTSGPSVRLKDQEKTLLENLATRQGYAPNQVLPRSVGEKGVGKYTMPDEAGGPTQAGAIQMAPMRKDVGIGGEYNARSREGGQALAEEIAHDATLSDTTRSQQVAREVAPKYGADPDSLASLMTTSFDEEYFNRPQEKVAKSMTPAVMAIAGLRDSSSVDPMQLDMAGRLLEQHGGAGGGAQKQALVDMIRSRPSGVPAADPRSITSPDE